MNAQPVTWFAPQRPVEGGTVNVRPANPPADAPVVVSMTWSKVVAGDWVLDPRGNTWHVNKVESGLRITVSRGGVEFTAARNPDETVDVLVPAIERESVALIRGVFASARVLPERKVS
jgi:hypothetical protein